MPSPSFLTLGAELASEQDRILAGQSIREPELLRQSRESLHAAFPKKHRLRLLMVGLCVVVTTAMAVLWFVYPVVGYTVVGGATPSLTHPRLGRWMASANEPTTLRFSDGSVAKPDSKTRFRVVETGRRGASLLVESGSVELSVAGTYMTEYLLGAGPFTLAMTKGRVKVSFNAMTDTLDLVVHDGVATLSGCQFGAGVSVAAQSKSGLRCSK